MIIRTVHTTLAKGKDDGKETGSRPSGIRRRRRGTGQGEETGGSLRLGLAKAGVVQAKKKEPRNAARGPEPAGSDDDVEVRGGDGRNRRLSWCWSGEGRGGASKAGAT